MYRYLLPIHILFLIIAPVLCQAQAFTAIDSSSLWPSHAYVVLQAENALFPVHHVQAQGDRKGFYTNRPQLAHLEIYNLLIPACISQQLINQHHTFLKNDTLLISFSMLPDSSGNILWQPIDLDTIPTGHLRSLDTVVHEAMQRIVTYRQAGNPKDHRISTRFNLFPIIQRQGRYWVPKQNVLTQYFLVRTALTHSLVLNDYITINVKSPAISPSAPWRTIRALLPKKGNYPFSHAMGIARERSYQDVHKFWSRPEISVYHDSALPPKNNIYSSGLREFGIGAFEYKPRIGIVAGAYNSYFNLMNPRVKFGAIIVDDKMRLR